MNMWHDVHAVLTESQKDNRCQFPLHLKSDVSLPCKLCQEIVVQYYSSLISSSRLGDGWGDLMTQKRYCFEDTWYVLTSPTGEQKRCFPLPQATWEEVSGKYFENLIHVTWSLGEYRDLGCESFLRKPKSDQKEGQTSCMFTNCGYTWVFLRAKCTYVSNLLCNTTKVRLINGMLDRWIDGYVINQV